MLTIRRNGEAEHTMSIGGLVGQAVFNQPVEHTIECDAIERRFAKGLFDLVVTQGSRCRTQQLQHTNARRRRTSTATADLLGD